MLIRKNLIQNCFGPTNFWTQIYFGPQIYSEVKKGADQGFLLPNGSNCEPPGESGRGFLMS